MAGAREIATADNFPLEEVRRRVFRVGKKDPARAKERFRNALVRHGGAQEPGLEPMPEGGTRWPLSARWGALSRVQKAAATAATAAGLAVVGWSVNWGMPKLIDWINPPFEAPGASRLLIVDTSDSMTGPLGSAEVQEGRCGDRAPHREHTGCRSRSAHGRRRLHRRVQAAARRVPVRQC